MEYSLFLHKIEQQLDNLEANRFIASEIEGLTAVMKMQAKAVMAGKAAFSSKATTVKFLGAAVKLQIFSINDEWAFRMASRMRTIAVSTTQVTRLPWEDTLFGENTKIAGTAETIDFKPEQLASVKNVRTAAIRMLVGTGANTFSEYRSILCTKESKAALRALDRFWDLESELLEHAALNLGISKLHAMVLDSIPKAVLTKELMDNILVSVCKLQDSALAITCGREPVDMLVTLHSMMSNFFQGRGPSAESLAMMCQLYKNVFARFEPFLVYGKGDTQTFGKEAMRSLWVTFEAIPMEQRGLNDIAIFKQFAWLLTKPQHVIVTQALHAGVRQYRLGAGVRALADGPAAEIVGGAPMLKDAGGSDSAVSTASTASTLAVLASPLSSIASSSSNPAGSSSSPADPLAAQKAKLLAMYPQ